MCAACHEYVLIVFVFYRLMPLEEPNKIYGFFEPGSPIFDMSLNTQFESYRAKPIVMFDFPENNKFNNLVLFPMKLDLHTLSQDQQFNKGKKNMISN